MMKRHPYLREVSILWAGRRYWQVGESLLQVLTISGTESRECAPSLLWDWVTTKHDLSPIFSPLFPDYNWKTWNILTYDEMKYKWVQSSTTEYNRTAPTQNNMAGCYFSRWNFLPPYLLRSQGDNQNTHYSTLKITHNPFYFNFKWEMANYDDTSPDELGKTINRYKWTLFILNVIAFIASIATFAVCIWIRYNIFFCAISFL